MDKKKVAVLISCFDWYKTRLKYIERHLQSIGYNVLIVTSDYNHIAKQKDRQLLKNKNIRYISTPGYKRNISIKRIWSHYYFAKGAGKIVEEIKPELVYVLIPPNYLLKEIRKTKIKYSNFAHKF